MFNPVTGAYEGDGHSIPRSTRDRHVNDDKRREQAISMTSLNSRSALASNNDQGSGWIQRIVHEINLLSNFPVTTPRQPLVFKYKPALNGIFQWPGDQEIVIGNHGLHALANVSANEAYLSMEQRFCELFAFVRHSSENLEATNSLLDRLHLELCRLNREKEVEWTRQRVDPNVSYINTGDYRFFFS